MTTPDQLPQCLFLCINPSSRSPLAPIERAAPLIDSGTAILFSGLVALVALVFNIRSVRSTSKKQHTYSVIKENQSNEKMDSGFDVIFEALNSGKKIGKAHLSSSELKEIDFLLNQHEYIAAGIMSGDIDEALIYRSEKSRFVGLYTCCKEYIDSFRGEQNSWCENLEEIHERWKEGATRTRTRRLIEWWLMRPLSGKIALIELVKHRLR